MGEKLSALIFDWDGVIVDSLHLQIEYTKTVCTHFKVVYPYKNPEEFKASMLNPLDKIYDSCGIPWQTHGEELRALFVGFMATRPLLISNETSNALKALKKKGFRLGIATMNCHSVVEAILKHNKIEGIFEKVVTAEDVKNYKPHPEALLKCAELMGVSSKVSAYIGDLPTDVQAAKTAGMKSIAVVSSFSSLQALQSSNPDFICHSFSDLLEWHHVNS